MSPKKPRSRRPAVKAVQVTIPTTLDEAIREYGLDRCIAMLQQTIKLEKAREARSSVGPIEFTKLSPAKQRALLKRVRKRLKL